MLLIEALAPITPTRPLPWLSSRISKCVKRLTCRCDKLDYLGLQAARRLSWTRGPLVRIAGRCGWSFRMTLLLSSSVSTVPRSRQSQGAKEFPKFGDAALVGRNAFSGKRAIAHFVMANTSARTASSQNTSCQRYVLWQRSNVN
jgi:hypothetical protein